MVYTSVDIYPPLFEGYACDWGYLDGVIDRCDYGLLVAFDVIYLEYSNDY